MNDRSNPSYDLSPVELIVLQGNSLCNLNCSYCDLSPTSRRTNSRMELDLVDRLFTELYKGGRLASEVDIVWHSGEPLTLPPSYYDQAISRILELKEKFNEQRICVKFGIQSNGVLINEEWCEFFVRHRDRLSLGISCDGDAGLHDAFRVTWAGRPTHNQVERGMDLLAKHGIKYKIIAVVTKRSIERSAEFYNYFFSRRDHLSGFHFNILAQANGNAPGLSYKEHDRSVYYDFFRQLLALNRASIEAGTEFEVQNFSQCLQRIMESASPQNSSFSEETSAPLKSLSIDSRGNVTTFYAGIGIDTLPDLYSDGRGFSIGNILDTPFEEMVRSSKLRRMMDDFVTSTNACKSSCEYFAVCSGGFEVTKKLNHGTFDSCETTECLIHVKALVDALLDDASEYLDKHQQPPEEVVAHA